MRPFENLTRRTLGLWSGAGMATVALAGCGRVDGAQNRALRRAINGSPVSIDPHAAYDDAGMNIITDLFEGLVARNAAGQDRPGVASDWDISEDGLIYTFQLRTDATWSDGSPLVAADFVASWRRLVTPLTAAPFANMLFAVRNAQAVAQSREDPDTLGVEAIGLNTLRVELERPTPFFLSQLGHYSLVPVPTALIAERGDGWTSSDHMISNGAYMLSDWKRGQSLLLTANPNFRIKPEIDRVEHVVSDDRQVEVLRFRSGDLDATFDIPATQIEWLQKKMPDAVRLSPRLMTVFLAINLDNSDMADDRVRRALAMTVERDVIVARISRGGETPAYGPVPPALRGDIIYRPEWSDDARSTRLDRARALMREAGYGPDNPLELELFYSTDDTDRRIFIAASAMWADIFVRAKLLNVEPRATVDLRRRRAFHMIRIPWVADYPHRYNFLEFLLSDAGGLNFSNYQNPDFDAAMAAGNYDVAERIAMEDWPILPLYTASARQLVSPDLEGWIDNSLNVHPTRFLSRRIKTTS